MIVEERPPGLGRRLAAPNHVLAHAALTDLDAEIQQFAVNVGSAPEWILATEHADQLAYLLGYRRAARFAAANFPAPEQAKSLALPAHHGGRLEDGKARFPAVPDRGEPGPKEAVSGGELRTLNGALEYTNLMAQGEDLKLQGGSAPKRGAQEGEKSGLNGSKAKTTDE